ncbi:hypothetical protein [Halomonas halocynthiae]|uniref:hypothetical protein n=1 Tax=Halomonas halocynthiae TaxID=176290 RepID=UPI0004130A81|nr:hypothetical protein [Halomonas halocynthiae]
MALYLLVFAVCLLVIGSVLAVLMLSRTPRYLTQAEDLLTLFAKALDNSVSETEWNTIMGYPIRHDEFLEGVRRRALRVMEEHGRYGRAQRGGQLLDTEGQAELNAMRDHLNARTELRKNLI